MTLAEAQARLAIWIAAETKVAKKQSYEVAAANGGSRRLTYVDAAEIRENIRYWRGEVATLEAAAASSSNNGSQVIYAGRVR